MTTTALKFIDILIVDDSELVRTGLKTLLDAHARTAGNHLRMVGEASTANSAVAETVRLKPDVVLMDIRLPDGSGLEACRKILASDPDTKVLILTSVIDDNLVYDAMSSGAHGYLLKEINAQGLCQAIVDVAALVAEGKTNKEIAESMGLSDKTVKNYLSNIFEKLKISRRSQAAVLYTSSRGSTR
jgi:two-component system, NarL family, response regulator DevR